MSGELVRNITVPSDQISNAKLSLFADWGQAYDRAALPGQRWKGIASAGASAKFRTFDTFDVKFDVATPIVRDDTTNIDSSPEIFFSLEYSF